MKIGITGPIGTQDIACYLDRPLNRFSPGYAGAPFLGTLIGELIKKGHQVSAYTHDVTTQYAWTASGPSFKFYVFPCRPHSLRFNGNKPGRIVDFFKIERASIQKAIESDNLDIVHAHWSYEFALAALHSGRPHLITCHDSPSQVLRFVPNLYRLGRCFMAAHVFRKGINFTVVSDYLKNELQGKIKRPVMVIPNPIAEEWLETSPAKRIENFNPETPQIAMTLNGWQKRKNPEAALKAFHRFQTQLPKARLHLFGHDFEPGGKAQIWAKKNRLDQSVHFYGFLSYAALRNELKKMDILLHPALEEACPMSLVEAMALALPVIGGNKSGGVPWILDYGKAGILTDVRAPEAIKASLIEIVTNKNLYTVISTNASNRAKQIFSVSAVTAAYENAYVLAIRRFAQN